MTDQKANSSNSSLNSRQDLMPQPNDGYVVGIDIGGTNLRLAIADMSGIVMARWSSSTADIHGADAVVSLISRGVENLLQQTSIPRSLLRSVAAGVPGVTDVDTGVVIATSYLMGWRDIPFRDRLEAALGVPAAVDNDVNLAALGEGWVGIAKETSDFVFLAIGTGIGAGIVLNGCLYRGVSWAAGEIGYMLVPETLVKSIDPGEPGALESVIGGEGIKVQWHRLWNRNVTTLPEDLTATEIFDAALAGDSLAQSILAQTARILTYAIYNISLVLNCPLIVLGGGVGMHQALCDETQKTLDQLGERVQLRVTRSTLGTEAQLMGAIRLALDTALCHETF